MPIEVNIMGQEPRGKKEEGRTKSQRPIAKVLNSLNSWTFWTLLAKGREPWVESFNNQ